MNDAVMTHMMKADLESLEVVDKDVWKPELVNEFQIDWNHLTSCSDQHYKRLKFSFTF